MQKICITWKARTNVTFPMYDAVYYPIITRMKSNIPLLSPARPWQERLAHLKRHCQPHITEAAKSSVEGICTKMYTLSVEYVKRIHDKHWQLLAEVKMYRE